MSESIKNRKKALTRKEVYIKNGDKVRNVGPYGGPRLRLSLSELVHPSPRFPPHPQKAACERDALKAPGYENVKAVSEVVTPRFLCTGGVDPYSDPNTCRGEKGSLADCWVRRPRSSAAASPPRQVTLAAP